jgi:hypothetical protein
MHRYLRPRYILEITKGRIWQEVTGDKDEALGVAGTQ